MTTSLTKLIEENKWRPIAEAKPCEDYNRHCYLLRDKETFVYIGYSIDGMSWFESGSEVLRVYPTHFRPLPDDRLARVTDLYDKFIEQLSTADAAKTILDWPKLAQNIREQATAIAEGKE